jgi:hypothetical protein
MGEKTSEDMVADIFLPVKLLNGITVIVSQN